MTETPAARHHLEQQAGSLTTGSHIVLPDGGRTAEVHQVELERDDFGAPALVLASLTGGGTLRIAVGTAEQSRRLLEAWDAWVGGTTARA